MIGKSLRKIISKITLNILYNKEKEIHRAYISKHTSTREKLIILLIIRNEEKEGRCHYLALKKLSELLHRMISKNKGDFYFLNCLYSFRTENKLKSHEKVCKTKISVELQCHQKRIIYQNLFII